jgi:hypothetical protein
MYTDSQHITLVTFPTDALLARTQSPTHAFNTQECAQWGFLTIEE